MTKAKKKSKSLVLVVGAGASSEVNLPIGNTLKDQIAHVLDIRYEDGYQQSSGDRLIDRALKELAQKTSNHNTYFTNALRSCWRIRDAMPQAISIDNFIDSHRKDESIATCGKLGIARCILEAESKSFLQVDRSNTQNMVKFKKTEKTWFNSFFQLLTENCQKEDITHRFDKITIISFNYDRCIEHYLHQALQNYYGMSSIEASEAIAALEIHHPYGKVGALPWMDQTTGIEFGAEPSPLKLINLAAQLRTFTEGTDPNTSDIYAIRTSLASAARIAFLGFAFHRLNLELLFPKPPASSPIIGRPVFATAFGISKSDIESIKTDLSAMSTTFRESMYFGAELTCAQLFREHWRGLSLT